MENRCYYIIAAYYEPKFVLGNQRRGGVPLGNVGFAISFQTLA